MGLNALSYLSDVLQRYYYHHACGPKGSSHLSPFLAYEFLSRCKFSTLRPDLMREIENADRKRKTAFFDLDFSIRKKSYLILRKALYFFLIEKSRSKNGDFSHQKKKLSYLKKSYIFFDQKKELSNFKKIYIFFSDRKIQIEKRRFSFSISHKIGSYTSSSNS